MDGAQPIEFKKGKPSFLDIIKYIWLGIRERRAEGAMARANPVAFAAYAVGKALWSEGWTPDMLIEALADWKGMTPPDLMELVVAAYRRRRPKYRASGSLETLVRRNLRYSVPAWELWKTHYEKFLEDHAASASKVDASDEAVQAEQDRAEDVRNVVIRDLQIFAPVDFADNRPHREAIIRLVLTPMTPEAIAGIPIQPPNPTKIR